MSEDGFGRGHGREITDVVPVRSSNPCGQHAVPHRLHGARHSLAENTYRHRYLLSDSVLLHATRTDDGADLLEPRVRGAERLLDRPSASRACPNEAERRRAKVVQLVFRTMSPREMIMLLKLATWEHAETGECFVERHKPSDRLMVIYSGRACAEVDGLRVTELEPDQFIGSIDYATQETAPADILAIEPTRYVSWPKLELKDFMRRNPELHSALKSTLAIDLARWIQASWAREANNAIERTGRA